MVVDTDRYAYGYAYGSGYAYGYAYACGFGRCSNTRIVSYDLDYCSFCTSVVLFKGCTNSSLNL